jgi:hypothetical protein
MFPLFVIVILVALVLQRIFVRSASDSRSIRYECKPSVRSCEPGAEFLVFSTVQNHSRLKTPAIRMEEHFPHNLNVLESEEFNIKNYSEEHRIYYSTVTLHRRELLRRSLRASISERGEYRFAYADFHAGDFLGFWENDYRIENDHSIVIYPPKLENADFLKAFTNEIDEIALKKQFLEDPISVRGYREYTGREPMRNISWTQSAVRGSLIVKQFDPVWSQSVLILFDTEYHGNFDQYNRLLEYCFSLTRTVCDILEQRQIGYRLMTNAIISSGISSFTGGTGTDASYGKILFSLGIAKNGSICTVEELTRAACLGAARREVIVFISSRRDKKTDLALQKAKALSCGQVLTLFAEELCPAQEEGRQAV